MSKAQRSRRPAEQQLLVQFAEERDSLLGGFESRRAVLRWGQKIAVRTLGQIPQRRFHQLAESFRPDAKHDEGPLLAAFLTSTARTRGMEDEVAEKVRERWAADVLGTVQVKAFRDLRKDAGEFVGESKDPEQFDLVDQDFAMRPALSDLDNFQSEALEMIIEGLDSQSQILQWGDLLTSATRGEPIMPDRQPGTFVPKAYREDSTVTLLTKQTDAYQRARESFIARWLLPAFNRGVRDLTGRTTEEPRATGSDYDDNPGDWE